MWSRDRTAPARHMRRPAITRLVRVPRRRGVQRGETSSSLASGVDAVPGHPDKPGDDGTSGGLRKAPTIRPFRVAILLAAALAAPLLTACSFGPVYSSAAQTQSALTLRYADPASRLEQVFYQELARELGRVSDPAAPVLSASIGITETRVGLSSATSPISDRQIIATASWTVTEDGIAVSTGKRTAVSGYQRSGQAFADDRAEADAEEQAVRAVAASVRLALLADLAGP